jgi:hypothetical protein
MNRIALISSSFVSFLSFANPEKGVPNSGISILLSYLFWLSPNTKITGSSGGFFG